MTTPRKTSSPAATRLKLLLTTLCLLVLAQAFNGGLSLSSLEKLFLGSMVSRYQVVANDFLGSIQKAMRFGKPLEKFVGIRPLMDSVSDELPDLSNVMVADRSGTILYSLDQAAEGRTWPAVAGPKPVTVSEGKGRPTTLKSGESYYVEFPINKTDREGKVEAAVGTAVFSFHESNVRSHLKRVLMDNLDVLLLISLAGAALIGLGLQFLLPLDAEGFSRLRLYLILLIGLGGAQIVYSWYNVETFRENYIRVARDNTEQVARMLRDDVEFLLDKGLRVNRLFKIDEHLAGIVQATPEVREISILDAENHVLYTADSSHGATKPAEGAVVPPAKDDRFYDLRIGLFRHKGSAVSKPQGAILVHLDKQRISDRVREIVLDSITVSVIGVLFMLELVILFLIYIRKSLDRGNGDDDALRYGIIRPVGFLFLFAMDLSITFIPLHMERLYAPLWGLSKDIVLGLPISVEMLFAGIFVVAAGLWMDRRGWKEPFFIGLALAAGGCAWSGLAPDMLHFIASRALIGSGYGLALMAAEGFVVDNTGPDSRARGITHLFAGVYAGSLCGGAAGAMLADRLGYRPVFLVSALIMALVIGCVALIVRGPSRRPSPAGEPAPDEVDVQAPPLTVSSVMHFFLDRNIFAAVFFSIVPAALLVVGFINYLLPIYLNRIGTSQSDIGRVLMIYNVCLIYMAPLLGNAIDKARFKGRYVVLSGVVAAVGLMGFWFQGGLFMTAFAMFMLGVSSSIGFGAQNAFVLNLKATEEAGHGAAMGITNAMERIGQVLGPLVLGGMVVLLGVQAGIAATGAAVLVLSLAFLAMARADALADALAASASALTANHHGLDTHPQSVQGVLAYALGSPGACPVLACGMVPLASFSYPRGLTLARPDPATGSPPRVPLFPASMRPVLVHAAPPLTADMARRALKRVRAMPGAGQATADEAACMARFIETDCLDPAVLALPRYADQAVVLQARLLERLLPDGPRAMVLELEDLAVDLLLDDLAGRGGRDSLTAALCLDPRIRAMVLEALDGVEGCWNLDRLDRLASLGGGHEARSGAGTALFWGLDAKGRRVPMACLERGGGAVLRGLAATPEGEAPEVPDGLEVPLRADALRQALRQGRLAPGLMLSYAAVGFARGLRCCGGVFQSDYMLAMRRGLAEVLHARGARAEAEAVAAVPVDNFIAGPEVAFVRARDGLRPAGLVELAARGGMSAGAMDAAGRLTLRQGLLAGLVDLVEEFVEPEQRPEGWRRDVDEWLAETSGATLL